MDAYAQAQLLLWPMSDAEGAHSLQQCQGHAGHLTGMEPPISNWEPRNHHVGIANCLYLGCMWGAR